MSETSKYNIIIFSDDTHDLMLAKPVGAFKIACQLRQAGFSVQVISHLHIFTVDELKEILTKLVNPNTLFVGFSPFYYSKVTNNGDEIKIVGGKELGAMIPHGVEYNSEIRELVKKLNPNCKLVLGGPDARDSSFIKDYDYTITGYGDLAAINLARHLAYGEELLNSRRTLFKSILIDGGNAAGYDFASTPMRYEDHDFVLPGEVLSIEVARGCIFRCKFCGFPLNGKKKNDYIKLENVIRDEFLDNYNKFGVTRYSFVDDTFNDNPVKLEMMHRVAKSLPFKLQYWAFIRMDLLAAHPETIDLLIESGCTVIYFGIETLHPAAGSVIGKKLGKEKVINTIRSIKEKYGDSVILHGTFIFGLPKEPLESMKETAELLINRTILLDSWDIRSLRLRPPTANFPSEFDLTPEKYGYRIIGTDGEFLDWESNQTNRIECFELAKTAMERSIDAGIKQQSVWAFRLSSLGLGLDFALNKRPQDVKWKVGLLKKKKLAKEYKRLLFEHLQIKK